MLYSESFQCLIKNKENPNPQNIHEFPFESPDRREEKDVDTYGNINQVWIFLTNHHTAMSKFSFVINAKNIVSVLGIRLKSYGTPGRNGANFIIGSSVFPW